MNSILKKIVLLILWFAILPLKAQVQAEYWINDDIDKRGSVISTENGPYSIINKIKMLQYIPTVNKISFRFRQANSSLWSVPYTTYVRTVDQIQVYNEIKGCRYWIDNDLENICFTKFTSGQLPDVFSKLPVYSTTVSRMHQVFMQFVDLKGLFSVPIQFSVFVTNRANGIKNGKYALCTVYPNPIVDGFYLGNIEGIERIEIYNLNGELQKSFLTNRFDINKKYDVSDLATGIYLLSLYNDKNIVVFKVKIVKK